jgi:hypothetical protein
MVCVSKLAICVGLGALFTLPVQAQNPTVGPIPSRELPPEHEHVGPVRAEDLFQTRMESTRPEPNVAASTTVAPPTLSASWGARWQNGAWIGGVPHDTGADFADPTLVVATDRLLSAVENYFGIFFDPVHGEDHFGNFGSSLVDWFAPALPPAGQGKVWYVIRPQLLRNPACPDGLGNLRECEVLVVGANRSDTLDSLIVVGTNYWTGPQEFGTWNMRYWDVMAGDSNAAGTYIGGLWAGQTSNALVVSMDLQSRTDGKFKTSKVMILPKAALYPATAGQPLPLRWFTNLRNGNGTLAYTVVPSVTYLQSPVTYLVNSIDPGNGVANQLSLWTVNTNDLSHSSMQKSTLTVAKFSVPPNAEQAATKVQVSTSDARIASVAAAQSTALWVTHATGCTIIGDAVQRSCVRWYEINPGSKALLQQGTVGVKGAYLYYPAVAANARGDMTLAMAASASNAYVGVYYTGRRASDPPGQVDGFYLLRDGDGCYERLFTGNTNYVGARSAAVLDPTDGRSFWITGAFTGGGSSNCTANGWGTWLGRITW